MSTLDDLGVNLAMQIDWSDFGSICQTIYCRCNMIFRSHHKIHKGDEKLIGVSMAPCPQCASHVNALRISSDLEQYSYFI